MQNTTKMNTRVNTNKSKTENYLKTVGSFKGGHMWHTDFFVQSQNKTKPYTAHKCPNSSKGLLTRAKESQKKPQ